MKVKHVQENPSSCLNLVGVFGQKVNPNDVRLIGKKLWQLSRGKPVFDLFTTVPIDKNFHIEEPRGSGSSSSANK